MKDMRQLLGEREETPAQVKHCVRKVAAKHGGDTSRAFAICVAAGQKHGTLKPGTMQSTAKGKKADSAKKKDPDHASKVGDYEKMLSRARDESVTEATMKKLKWEKKDDQISVAFVTVESETTYGKPKKIQVALRVDGRSGSWRVDMATAIGSTWMPFEAIDNGNGLASESQAKAHAAKWLAAANDQKTVHPNRIESKDTMPSLRSAMLELLGETHQDTFQTRRDAGPTSTGVTNKPAKKTPVDKAKPPRSEDGAGDEGEASATATPTNSPAQKKPMKAGIAPPNVRGSGAVEDAKRITRVYAGIDNKYGLKAGDIAPEPEDEAYLSTIKEDVSEDPILKIAREAMRSPNRHHPFE